MPIDLGGAVGPRNIQSVTTILDVSSIWVNWLVEPICTVLDMAKWYEEWKAFWSEGRVPSSPRRDILVSRILNSDGTTTGTPHFMLLIIVHHFMFYPDVLSINRRLYSVMCLLLFLW